MWPQLIKTRKLHLPNDIIVVIDRIIRKKCIWNSFTKPKPITLLIVLCFVLCFAVIVSPYFCQRATDLCDRNLKFHNIQKIITNKNTKILVSIRIKLTYFSLSSKYFVILYFFFSSSFFRYLCSSENNTRIWTEMPHIGPCVCFTLKNLFDQTFRLWSKMQNSDK